MSIVRTPSRDPATGQRPGSLRPALVAVLLFAAAFIDSGGTAGQSIVIEMRQGAFEDARVQRAILLAANWPALAADSGLRPDSIVMRVGQRENEVEARQSDPDAARRLLAEAGYAGRQPLQHFILFEPPLEKMALGVAGLLKDIGVIGQLQVITPETRDKVLAATRFLTGRQSVEYPYLLLTLEKFATPAPPRLADLSVIGRPQADFAEDSRILTVSARVANLAGTAAGAHLLRFVDRDGLLEIPPLRIEGLGPRESRSFKTGLQLPKSLLGREVVLLAIIDSEREVRESEEGNNRSEPLVLILPAAPQLADLLLRGKPEAFFDPAAGQLTIRVTLANAGGGAAGPHLLALADRSGIIEFPPFEVAELASRESLRFETTVPVPEAILGRELLLLAQADAKNGVRESNEENNFSETLAFRLPLPLPDFRPLRKPDAPDIPSEAESDLRPEHRSAPPIDTDLTIAALQVSQQVQTSRLLVRLTIANRGSSSSPPSVVELRSEGTMERIPVPELAAGALWQASWSAPLNSGIFGRELSVVAFVDPDDTIAESVEANNRSQQMLAVAIPARSWLLGTAIAAGFLLVAILLLRIRPGSGKATPQAVQLSYRTQRDHGAQEVLRRGEEPALLFELSLRPRPDPGSQTVTSASR